MGWCRKRGASWGKRDSTNINPWVSNSNEPRRWHVRIHYASLLGQEKSSADANISGYYSWRVQFVDIYGNKGKASAANPVHRVPHESEFTNGIWEAAFPTVIWRPPVREQHVTGVNVGRSSNQHKDDSVPGSEDVMHLMHSQSNVTQTRVTDNIGDGVLTSLTSMDLLRPHRWGARLEGESFLSA